jgi:hypothetical protein
MDDLTQDEIDNWAEGKSLEEIADAWHRDSTKLRSDLGLTAEDLPRGRGDIAVENAIVSKLEENEAQRQAEATKQYQREVRIAQAQNDREGREVMWRFLERHPEYVPSEELGNRLRDEYLAIAPDANQWDDTTLEMAYSNLLIEKLEGRE